MHLTSDHAAAELEILNAKAVILLSQGIPESVGHVHQAFSIKVGRAVGH
jgi:hypothetical protein